MENFLLTEILDEYWKMPWNQPKSHQKMAINPALASNIDDFLELGWKFHDAGL